jgi:VRR-NUC domain
MSIKEYKALGNKDRQPRKNEEHNHQAAFFEILNLNTRENPNLQYIHAIPNGDYRPKSVAARLKAEGVKSGVADIFTPIRGRGFSGMYLEMKFGNNIMSPSQIKFRDFVLTQGFFFKTCYTVDEAVKTVEWYLGIDLRIR